MSDLGPASGSFSLHSFAFNSFTVSQSRDALSLLGVLFFYQFLVVVAVEEIGEDATERPGTLIVANFMRC